MLVRAASHIPKETLLLCVAGDHDNIVGNIDAKRIFHESTQVPHENKNYVTLVSDAHGQPALSATHMAPVAIGGSLVVPIGLLHKLIPSFARPDFARAGSFPER